MPLLLNNRRRLDKPPLGARIAFGHPLARGLKAAWLCNEAAGLPWSQGSPPLTAPAATVSAPGWENVGGMLGATFNGAVVGYGDVELDNANQMTVIMSIRPTNLTQGTGILNKRTGSTSANAYSFGFNYSGTNNFTCELGNAGGTATGVQYRFSTSGWSTARYQQIAIVYDGTLGTGSRIRMWRENVEITSPTIGTEGNNAIPNTAVALEIGRVNSTGTAYYLGGLAYIYLFDRALSAHELQTLWADPFAIVQPITRRMWGFSDAAPSGTIMAHPGVDGGFGRGKYPSTSDMSGGMKG